MTTEMQLALDLRHALNVRDIQVHQSRSGHWHPKTTACDCNCPMAHNATAVKFSRTLASAAGFPNRNPYL